MAQRIILKKSATAGLLPTSTDLNLGEIGINTTDGKLYIKRADNTIIQVGGVGNGSDIQNTINSSIASQVPPMISAGLSGGMSTSLFGADNLELAVNRTTAGSVHLDFHTEVGSDYDARIIRSSGTNGNLQLLNVGAGTIQAICGGNYLSIGATGVGINTVPVAGVAQFQVGSSLYVKPSGVLELHTTSGSGGIDLYNVTGALAAQVQVIQTGAAEGGYMYSTVVASRSGDLILNTATNYIGLTAGYTYLTKPTTFMNGAAFDTTANADPLPSAFVIRQDSIGKPPRNGTTWSAGIVSNWINTSLDSTGYTDFNDGGQPNGTQLIARMVPLTHNQYTAMSAPTNGVVRASNTPVAQAVFSWDGSSVIVRSSFNVSSVIREGVGRYRINFGAPLSNTSYYCMTSFGGAYISNCFIAMENVKPGFLGQAAKTTSGVPITVVDNSSDSLVDINQTAGNANSYVFVQIYQ